MSDKNGYAFGRRAGQRIHIYRAGDKAQPLCSWAPAADAIDEWRIGATNGDKICLKCSNRLVFERQHEGAECPGCGAGLAQIGPKDGGWKGQLHCRSCGRVWTPEKTAKP